MTEPRDRFWIRARGCSKTFDAGAAALAAVLSAGLDADAGEYLAALDEAIVVAGRRARELETGDE